MGRGFAWFDAGTHDALLEAAQFIQVTQNRQGILIASPEEIAWRAGWITTDDMLHQANTMAKTAYGEALLSAVEQP